MIVIQCTAGRYWDGLGVWDSDIDAAEVYPDIAAAERVIERHCAMSILMAGGAGGFRDDDGTRTAQVVSVDRTPAVADVLQRMSQCGESQEQAVRSLGGE